MNNCSSANSTPHDGKLLSTGPNSSLKKRTYEQYQEIIRQEEEEMPTEEPAAKRQKLNLEDYDDDEDEDEEEVEDKIVAPRINVIAEHVN